MYRQYGVNELLHNPDRLFERLNSFCLDELLLGRPTHPNADIAWLQSSVTRAALWLWAWLEISYCPGLAAKVGQQQHHNCKLADVRFTECIRNAYICICLAWKLCDQHSRVP